MELIVGKKAKEIGIDLVGGLNRYMETYIAGRE
jgi:hypothetical protein